MDEHHGKTRWCVTRDVILRDIVTLFHEEKGVKRYKCRQYIITHKCVAETLIRAIKIHKELFHEETN